MKKVKIYDQGDAWDSDVCEAFVSLKDYRKLRKAAKVFFDAVKRDEYDGELTELERHLNREVTK